VDERSSIGVVRHLLRELRGDGLLPAVLETTGFDPSPGDPTARFEAPPGAAERPSVGLAAEAWLLASSDEAVGDLWPFVFRGMAPGGPGPRVLARFDPKGGDLPVADLAAYGAIPRSRVAVPADAPATAAVLRALQAEPSPTYVRIPAGSGAPVTGGAFGWANAPTLVEGADLTLIGVGPILGEVRALAGRLRSIGIGARILDGASVKPIDAATIVRAARETGAILVAEEHPALTGFGSSVAALTSLAYPIPVRRVGYPDLPVRGSPAGTPGAVEYGPTASRLDEEAWELLKARGKVQ
jgi:Transketolase, C-terminal domain